MDKKLRNRISEYIDTIMLFHDENYPSVGELEALYESVKSEFKISKIDAQFEVLEYLWKLEEGL
jgi:hypothetical protein